MGMEQSKPESMVQAALDLGGVDVTGPTSPISTPRLPGKQATIVNDGSDGHSLGSGITIQPQKTLAKNSKPL